MRFLLSGLLAAVVTLPVSAADIESAYPTKTKVGRDAEVPGWFINLGVTGARVKLTKEFPDALVVAHVFDDTPADGKLELGDRIVSAQGERFSQPHRFGYGMDKFGYDGPLMEMGDALERCAAERKGVLELVVVRAGEEKKVELKLPARGGKLGETFPYDCKRSDALFERLLDYLVEEQKDDGLWGGRSHNNAFATLALMSGSKRAHRAAVERAVRAMAEVTQREPHWKGHTCWPQTLYGITLAEYYLLTKERWVLDELRDIDHWLRASMAPAGGWGHAPWRENGENGYGPICAITAQGMLAWSLIARCGIELDMERYVAAREFLRRGTNDIGYVWYKDDNAGDRKYADMGRTGTAVLAFQLSPFEGDGLYRDYAELGATCIGKHPTTFPDTHGSPLLGLALTALGAAVHEGAFRALMDENRWFFGLSETPEGNFVYQPNRDNNPQDYTAAPRVSASAAIALVLSLKERKLALTGRKLE